MKTLIAFALLASLTACDHAGHSNSTETTAKPAVPLNAAQKAYTKANDTMHKGMAAIPADPDVAFMAGMIPHHQGAIDMAKVVLEHGKDPKTRALAETIIKTQSTEIAEMEGWLKAKGVAPLTAADHAAMGH
jgi:uncharacterized protein (DUF305 family)